MMTRWILAALALGIVLPSHAARPRAATDEEQKYFELEEDVIAQDMVTVKGEAAYFILRKCRYELSFVDRTGNYFTGETGCLQQENLLSDGSVHNYQGGVWISTDARKPPRLFGVVSDPPETCKAMGVVLCALSKLEYGRFKVLPGRIKDESAAKIKIVSATAPSPAI